MRKATFGNERGVALLVALGTMAILSVLGIAALTVASGSIDLTVWDMSSNKAFQVAEGGFNQALSRAREGTLIDGGDFTAHFPNGEASVTVTGVNSFIYVIKSVGAHPSLAEPRARRAVSGTIVSIDPSKVFFADAAQGVVLGDATFNGPLYVRDEMALSGNGRFYTGPLFIKDAPATLNPTGDLVLDGSAEVGTAGEPILLFVDGTYPASNPNLHTAGVYSDVPDLEMPVITGADMPSVRADDADVVIDDDADTDGDTPLTLDWSAPTTTHGDYPGGDYLKWTNPPGNNRTLEVNGTVFVDGPVVIGAFQVQKVEYLNTGTIIANGNIAVNSEFVPDPIPSPKTDWPDGTAMGLVTPYQVDLDPKAGTDIFATVYAYEKITYKKRFYFYGTAITQLFGMNSNPNITIIDNISEGEMPPSMPEVEGQTFVSGWSEVQP